MIMKVESKILRLQSNSTRFYLMIAFLLISFSKSCNGKVESNVLSSSNSNSKTRPVVRIPHGSLRGVNMVTHHGRRIFGFMGIPFAQPPVGSLRFKAPLPETPWNIVLNASRDSYPCPQQNVDTGEVFGNEDCLYLNVYTPKLPKSENCTLLPVMIYVVGGGFTAGDNNPAHYGPYFILDKDVVLVVPNSRIGALGYLSTGDEASPGNYGLKDLVRALEWNRDNIEYFGGDPTRVTFVGGSSGGKNVKLLALSNATNGLFHRYVSQSGPALSPHAQHSKKLSAKIATRVGTYLDCPTNNSKVLVDCLRNLNTSQLVDTGAIFNFLEARHYWAPTVEPNIEGALLTDPVEGLLASGKFRDIPAGLHLITKDEADSYRRMLQNPEVFENVINNIDIILPTVLLYDDLVDNIIAYSAALKSYYLNDLTADRKLLLNNFTQLLSDSLFTYPLYRELEQSLIHSERPQYLCSFEYRGTFSHSYDRKTGRFVLANDSAHGDEVIYLFDGSARRYGPRESKMNEDDWKMVHIMVQLWTSFVINGVPTLSDPKITITFDPYSSRKNYLRIGNKSDVSLQVGDNFFQDRSQFWEQLRTSTANQID